VLEVGDWRLQAKIASQGDGRLERFVLASLRTGGGDLDLTNDHARRQRILCWMRLRGMEIDGYPTNARRIQKHVEATTEASKAPIVAFL
jgi:hypothetical protein